LITPDPPDRDPGDTWIRSEANGDWNHSFGISATYPNREVVPERAQSFRDMYCSGFLRMVFGVRGGIPPTGMTALTRDRYRGIPGEST